MLSIYCRLKGHKGPITDIRITPYNNVLISSSKDGVVKLWDLLTQHCFETLVGHRGEVMSVEMVYGGSKLVTASNHHKLRVFSLSQSSEEKVCVCLKVLGNNKRSCIIIVGKQLCLLVRFLVVSTYAIVIFMCELFYLCVCELMIVL